MPTTERLCQECNKPLKGRADKKFCDDNCRNAYNNKQGQEPAIVRLVNNTLKKNRRVLENILTHSGEKMAKAPKSKMAQQGLDFNYHTHLYTNKKGDIYYFCYEYGYLPLEGDWLLIVKRKDESEKQALQNAIS